MQHLGESSDIYPTPHDSTILGITQKGYWAQFWAQSAVSQGY